MHVTWSHFMINKLLCNFMTNAYINLYMDYSNWRDPHGSKEYAPMENDTKSSQGGCCQSSSQPTTNGGSKHRLNVKMFIVWCWNPVVMDNRFVSQSNIWFVNGITRELLCTSTVYVIWQLTVLGLNRRDSVLDPPWRSPQMITITSHIVLNSLDKNPQRYITNYTRRKI